MGIIIAGIEFIDRMSLIFVGIAVVTAFGIPLTSQRK